MNLSSWICRKVCALTQVCLTYNSILYFQIVMPFCEFVIFVSSAKNKKKESENAFFKINISLEEKEVRVVSFSIDEQSIFARNIGKGYCFLHLEKLDNNSTINLLTARHFLRKPLHSYSSFEGLYNNRRPSSLRTWKYPIFSIFVSTWEL